jgi:hypothetical protein
MPEAKAKIKMTKNRKSNTSMEGLNYNPYKEREDRQLLPCHCRTRRARWIQWKRQMQILDGPIDLISKKEMCSSQVSVSAFWVGAQLACQEILPLSRQLRKTIVLKACSHISKGVGC